MALKVPQQKDHFSKILNHQTLRSNSHDLQSEIENRKGRQAQGQRTDMSLASDGLTYTASLTYAEHVFSVDIRASRVLHVCVEAQGVRLEQRQQPRLRKHIFRWCQRNLFPHTKNSVSPQCPEPESLAEAIQAWEHPHLTAEHLSSGHGTRGDAWEQVFPDPATEQGVSSSNSFQEQNDGLFSVP